MVEKKRPTRSKEKKGLKEKILKTPVQQNPEKPAETSEKEVKEISTAVVEQVSHVYEEVPDFDYKELYSQMVAFIADLKKVLSSEKQEKLEAMDKYLKGVVISIAFETEKLKELNLSLVPEQQASLSQAVALLPEEEVSEAQKFWDIHLKFIVEFLQQYKAEGISMFATIGEEGFHVNTQFVEKAMRFFESTLEIGRKFYSAFKFPKDITDEFRELRTNVRAKIEDLPRFKGINAEDIADSEIDDIYYQRVLEDLEKGETPEKIALDYNFAIKVNFHHLSNSLVSQKMGFYQLFLEDVADGIEKDPGYYDEKNPNHLFLDEAEATALGLSVLDRSLKIIFAEQRLAEIMRTAKKANESQKD